VLEARPEIYRLEEAFGEVKVKYKAVREIHDGITDFIIYMTKLLQSDWLRECSYIGVQLMIFVIAGGSGKSKQQSPIWRRNLDKYF
jgi:hypothetical protein